MSGGDLINAAISTEELEVSATITTEEPEISAVVTTEEPEVAADLDELHYLVFQGMKGEPGEDGVSFVNAYLDKGVVRYVYGYGEHDEDDIYTSIAMVQDIDNGILPLLYYSPEDNVFDYFELDRYDISGATRVIYFRSKDYLLSVDSTGAYTLTDRPQGASASTTTPKMNGTAAVGSETAFARGDHVHPHDSEKMDYMSAITNLELEAMLQ